MATCNADLATCNSDLQTCESDLDQAAADLATCTSDLTTCQWALANVQRFPASGQTTCWDASGAVITCAGTGQDGDVRAGGALGYLDNGDGTITDETTRLMWEKKTATCPGVHCYLDTYTWPEALAFIATLNTPGSCFAGYGDWRLPNIKELMSLVNYEESFPAVSAIFHHDGPAGCSASCTASGPYWSSTSYATSRPCTFWSRTSTSARWMLVTRRRNPTK